MPVDARKAHSARPNAVPLKLSIFIQDEMYGRGYLNRPIVWKIFVLNNSNCFHTDPGPTYIHLFTTDVQKDRLRILENTIRIHDYSPNI